MPGNEYLVNIGFRLDGQGLANAQQSLRAFEREVQATSNKVSKYKFEPFAQGQQPSRTLRAADAVGGLVEAHKAQQEYLKLATTTATRKPAITPTFRGLKKSVDGYYENVVQNVGEQTKHLVSELQGLFERDSATGWRKGLETTFDKSVFGYTHVGEKIAMNYQQIIKDYGTQSFTKGIGTLYHELGHNLVGRAAQTTQYSLVNMPQAEYEQLKSPFTKGASLSQLSDNLRPWAANYRAVEMLSGLMGGKMAYQQGVPADLLKMEHYMSKAGMQGLFEQEGATAVQRHQQFMNTLQALGDADITTLKGQIMAWNNIEQMMKSEQTRAGTVFQGMNKDMMSAMKDIVGAGKHGRLNELMGLGISGLQQGTLVATQPLMGLEETEVPAITTDYNNLASSVQKFIDQGPQVTDAYMKHVSSAHRVATSLKGTTLEYEHQQAVIKEHIAALKEHASIGERMMAAGQTPETKPRPYSEADLKGIRDTTESYYSAIQDNIREMIYAQTKQVSIGKPPARYTGEYAKVAVAQLMPQIQQMMTDLPERVQQQIMQMTQHMATGGAGGEGGISGPFGIAMKRVTMWGGAAFLVYGTIRAVRKLIQEIMELDSAMQGLQAVMRDVDADFGHMKDRAFDLAHEYGRTATEIINGMTEIAKTGADEAEVLQKIEVAVLAANVAEIELADSAKVLTAAQEQFHLTTNDLISVVDSWNEVSRKARVGTGDLVDAMSAAGTAAGEVGVTFHQLNAMIASVAQATGKSGQEIGTAFKAMMSRTQLPKAVAALGEVGINVFGGQGELRDFSTILEEVAESWDGLTRAQQMNIANAMAEKKRYQYFLALMENYDTYLNMVEVSLNSEGSAAAENAIIMESLSKQFAQLKSVAQEAKMAFTDVFQTITKALMPVMTSIGKFIDFLTRLPFMNVVAGIGAMALALKGLEIYLIRVLQIPAGGLEKFTKGLTSFAGTRAMFGGAMAKGRAVAQEQVTRTYGFTSTEWDPTKPATAKGGWYSWSPERKGGLTKGISQTEYVDEIAKVEKTFLNRAGGVASSMGKTMLSGIGKVFKGIGSFLFSPMGIFMIGSTFISNMIDTLHKGAEISNEFFSTLIESSKQAAKAVEEEYKSHTAGLESIQFMQGYLNDQLDGTIARTMTETEIRKQLVTLAEEEAAAQEELNKYASEIAQKYPFLVTTGRGGELTINKDALNTWVKASEEATTLGALDRQQAAKTMLAAIYEGFDKGTDKFTLGFYNEAEQVGWKISNIVSLGMVGKFAKPTASVSINGMPLSYLGEDVSKLAEQLLPAFGGPEALEKVKAGEDIELTEQQLQDFIKLLQAQLISGVENFETRLKAAALRMGYSYNQVEGVVEDYKNLNLKPADFIGLVDEATKERNETESKQFSLLMTYLDAADRVAAMRDAENRGLHDTAAGLSAVSMELETLNGIIEGLEFILSRFSPEMSGKFTETIVQISKIKLDSAMVNLESTLGNFNVLEDRLATTLAAIDEQSKVVIDLWPEGQSPVDLFMGSQDAIKKAMSEALSPVFVAGQTGQFTKEKAREVIAENLLQVQQAFPEAFKDVDIINAADLSHTLSDSIIDSIQASGVDAFGAGETIDEAFDQIFGGIFGAVQNRVIELTTSNPEIEHLNNLEERRNNLQQQILENEGNLPDLIQQANQLAQAYVQGLQAHYFAMSGVPMALMQNIAQIGSQIGVGNQISGMIMGQYQGGLDQIISDVTSGGKAFDSDMVQVFTYGLQGLMQQEQQAQSGTKAASSAADDYWNNMKRILEHYKTLDQITIKQYIDGLKYLQSTATKLSDKLQIQEDIYNAEKELAGKRLDYGKKWLDHEYTLERMSLSEKVAYYKQLATLARTRDEKWQIEEEIFRMERDAIEDRLGKATKWLDHFVAMDAITKESQMKILRKMLEIAKGSSDIYAQWGIEEKIHQLQKEMEGSGESDFAKRIVRRAAGLESPLRMSLEEYKKFMGEGASATDEAKDMLSEFEEYMRQFGGAGRDAAVNTQNLNAIIEDLIDTEFDNTISTDQLYKAMQSLGSALGSEAAAANSAAGATVTYSQKIKDYFQFLIDNLHTQDEANSELERTGSAFEKIALAAKPIIDLLEAFGGGQDMGQRLTLGVLSLLGAFAMPHGVGSGGAAPSSSGIAAASIAGLAAQVKAPYHYGGQGPTTCTGDTIHGTPYGGEYNHSHRPDKYPLGCFDCSGLVSWAWGKAGVYLPHYSGSMWGKNFMRAPILSPQGLSMLKPGAMLFPSDPTKHVGMYYGNNMIVEASSTGQPVMIKPFNLGKWKSIAWPSLDTGGQTLGDGLAFLHKKEVILNPPLVEKLERNSVQPSVQYYDNSSMNVTIGGDDTGKMQKLLDDYTEKKARTIAREVNRLI